MEQIISNDKKNLRLASYAVDIAHSQGRRHKESYEGYLLPYQNDRNRIINSISFRRLEYKTQVFINYAGDHYRTRLTHSLEVAQIAKAIAYELNLNEDLTECIALAHDLGHPPFGHAGEDALQEVAKEFGGFDHNAQTLKILTYLEQRYAEFDGLNLTWETLEGIAKHNGPLTGKYSKPKKLSNIYTDITKVFDLKLETFASLEAQVASLADDIAYINHDIDDGYRAGFITISDLKSLDLLGEIFTMLESTYPNLSVSKMISEALRRLKKQMVTDLVAEIKRRISFYNIHSAEDIRNMHEPIAAFSKDMEVIKDKIKAFLFERIYRHYKINRTKVKACHVVKNLFETLMKNPNCMPTDWYEKLVDCDEQKKAEIIIDYIAGMTDRYAIEQYKKLFDPLEY
ncbi:deoxyguanosinetriphosphate triphosphohydrolase [endosymbiont of Acanthamoeba sp. UWC8]|uniref:deoxyguanosinetriphosphate triphosphohydrolase n=1 Tax=endosymbiont of Acanthamoeba sp. UWC8 TaxID=86106 RepID=UPI0004D18083|nr:deoxyguanosinetriphosphate triphosphohydrolase [endosymbiont of Acanthamoeba sp. UWC8]AIF81378.1 deoxyguanosinetriphosphate triphosphohydrolase [endosymbiont of Acanthamoeba sp. UWC8]